MRRTLMVAVVLALLATAGVSWAQTTTTSTSTTSTTSTSTSTTSSTTSTTSTTIVVPRLPTATLSGASGQVPGELSSNCWPLPNGVVLCAIDSAAGSAPNPTGPGPNRTLAVTQGESLTLRFDPALAVATLRASFWPAGPGSQTPTPLDVPASNPSSFRATMAPGTYRIEVNVTFSAVPAGYVFYVFQIRVAAPATTVRPAQPVTAGRLSLTG